MVRPERKRDGFTIVELLVVIVVISILAAITIVAYSGMQQRARNVARLQAAANIYKQLELYTHQTGVGFGNTGVACLPTEANYDFGSGDATDCWVSSSPWSEAAAVNSRLADAGYAAFSYPDAPIKSGSAEYRGIAIGYFSSTHQGMNGTLRPYALIFRLEGSRQNCGPNSVSNAGGSDLLNSIVPADYYLSYPDNTMCALSLTHHSSI